MREYFDLPFFTMGVPEKQSNDITPAPRSSGSIDAGKLENTDDAFEVFKKGDGAVDFRTVGWIQASVIFLKSMFEFPSPAAFRTTIPRQKAPILEVLRNRSA